MKIGDMEYTYKDTVYYLSNIGCATCKTNIAFTGYVLTRNNQDYYFLDRMNCRNDHFINHIMNRFILVKKLNSEEEIIRQFKQIVNSSLLRPDMFIWG